MAALLETKGLCYDYPDGTPALTDVSIRLNEGGKTALIGANGSGKSTLLMLLAGCFAPSRGEVLLRGEPAGQDLWMLKNSAGLVFQEPDDQLFMPSVLEDAAFGLVARDVPAEEARAIARACLEKLGIQHLADRPPHRLSGGEKRSAALAGILAMKPEIILLDEPSASLDPRARRNLIGTLRELDKTMVIATHDLEMASALCDAAVLLFKGRVAGEGFMGCPENSLMDEKFLRDHGL
ncbi:MAG: energy-coupling factor ABC transporter ATP-binding protein [Synergistaceae bacterium]|jgi:cobalt/nickel transport system ATP-binding protein|nr:energy-coupling factor ABC transporter ATP-binding protein [Synergistaceae bacterium]